MLNNFTFENFIFALGVVVFVLLMTGLALFGLYVALRCFGCTKEEAINIITLK